MMSMVTVDVIQTCCALVAFSSFCWLRCSLVGKRSRSGVTKQPGLSHNLTVVAAQSTPRSQDFQFVLPHLVSYSQGDKSPTVFKSCAKSQTSATGTSTSDFSSRIIRPRPVLGVYPLIPGTSVSIRFRPSWVPVNIPYDWGQKPLNFQISRVEHFQELTQVSIVRYRVILWRRLHCSSTAIAMHWRC